jgi:15,16-dihydrobiliverdin:ferredoxin oxidoreductase
MKSFSSIILSASLLPFTLAWVITSSRNSNDRHPRAAVSSIGTPSTTSLLLSESRRRAFVTLLGGTRLGYHSSDVTDRATTWELPSWLQRLVPQRRSTPDNSSTVNNKDGAASSRERQDRHDVPHAEVNIKDDHSSYQTMPWTDSIRPDDGQKLTYMPFRNWQMNFMEETLTNLRALPVSSHTGRDMSYIETPKRTHRMHTACYESDEYKLIRLTTLDAGRQTQVFTSLWYPRDSLAPVLGIDLLQFGQRHLCIVDFQPVTADRPIEQERIELEMSTIRNRYPSLQGRMTDRFYSATDTYFSKQMLLGRHDPSMTNLTADELVNRDLMPAFQQYVKLHVQCVRGEAAAGTGRDHDVDRQCIQELHAQYDTYSAARDPAHHLLARIFGQDWADEYVYDILFPKAASPLPPPPTQPQQQKTDE